MPLHLSMLCTHSQVKKCGYVRTLMGRMRWFPDVNSTDSVKGTRDYDYNDDIYDVDDPTMR